MMIESVGMMTIVMELNKMSKKNLER